MTVYVDDMYLYPLGTFGRIKMSHTMIATTETELHEMAAKIGVSRQSYQNNHYYISAQKWEAALKAGAQAIPLKQLTALNFLHTHGQKMGDPETAIARMLDLKNERGQQEAVIP
jgi:DNA-binding XRE family transcriptional regulator